MTSAILRSRFVVTATPEAFGAVAPDKRFAHPPATQRAPVRTGVVTAVVHPEFQGRFGDRMGSCVFGGWWVAMNSRVSSVNGYRTKEEACLDHAPRTPS